MTNGQLPGGPRATALHTGDYDEAGFTYETIGEWVAGDDYFPAGEPWECHLDEPGAPGSRTLVACPCRAVAAQGRRG